MTSITRMGERAKKLLLIGLGLIVMLQALLLAPGLSHAAIKPLPDPQHPLVFDDFDNNGEFKQAWQNWYNQSGGTGAFSKVTVDTFMVGKFAQTPASSASLAKFEPWHQTVNLTGYRYLNFKMKNPGYADARIRVLIHDGYKYHDLTGGFAAVPTTWTDTQIDLDALTPTIDKKRIRFEIWLKQNSGTYGEILIDQITGTTADTGNSPTLSAAALTSNSGTLNNQNTAYTFKVTYTDQDNDKPHAMQVVIDDRAYEMRESDYGDATYTDGKDYFYITKLPVGSHTYYFRAADGSSAAASTSPQTGPTVTQSANIIDVVVSQAGYSSGDYKNAIVTSTSFLADTTYQILNGSSVVKSGFMTYKGNVWGKFLYTIEFPAITTLGEDYTVTTNGISSYPFPIEENVWDGFKDEMTAFYRIQRSGVATSDAYPPGYSSIPPSAKVFHPAGHLDDAKSNDGTQSYDLTGGHYDAGDYGKYGANQWVGAQIALAYIRNSDSASVKYDNDGNDIPDLIDEAIFASEYLLKWADQFDGAMYHIGPQGGFVHPHKLTDNIPNTADDRKLQAPLSVEGSAKSAATLAATARAIHTAIALGDIPTSLVADLTAFANDSEAAAITFYDFMIANYTAPQHGDVNKSRILADVELYLLTNDTDYKDAATTAANALTFQDLSSTLYWSMRPMALAEFYPVADASTQAHIQDLLEEQFHYVMSLMDDTPYGVLNQFSNFGVNEPLISYIGDVMRYYELFEDPDALRVILRGLYWVFGQNPWNISWVSGVGSDHVDYLHSRLDEEANSSTNQGIVIPGAMVSGPNIKNPKDNYSISPWYEDNSVGSDNMNQWRYNEFSISIQAGLLYTIMGLSTLDNAASSMSNLPELAVGGPILGDYVRGNVTLFAGANAGTPEARIGGVYVPMTVSGSVYSHTIDVSADTPLSNRIVTVRGTDTAGNHTYSNAHYTVAQPLPDPSHPLLFDNFAGGGLWGSIGHHWVNWWNQNGGTNEGTFSKVTLDGLTASKFTQNPSTATAEAKFQHWNESFNVDGYRYVNMKVKNPSHPNLRMRATLSDGMSSISLTNGWISIPSTWTDLQFDTSAASPTFNRKKAQMTIWLKQTVKGYGEMFIDDIFFSNTAGGTAPTLTAGSVNVSTGNSLTNFTFNVTYTDADNEAPHAVELVADGVVRQMAEVNASDTNYADGKTYRITTRLPKGNHSYYFTTTDKTSDAVSTSVQTGPSVN
jgi:endoglucanase